MKVIISLGSIYLSILAYILCELSSSPDKKGHTMSYSIHKVKKKVIVQRSVSVVIPQARKIYFLDPKRKQDRWKVISHSQQHSQGNGEFCCLGSDLRKPKGHCISIFPSRRKKWHSKTGKNKHAELKLA